MRSLFIICAVALNLGIFTAESLDSSTTNAAKVMTGCANKFAPNLYEVLSRTRQNNVVLPTFSTFMAMSMAAHGAGGKTESQIREILQLPEDKRDVLVGIEALRRRLQTISRVSDVTLINQMLHADDVAPKSDFEDVARRVFGVIPRRGVFEPSGAIKFDNRAWFGCHLMAQNIGDSLIFFNNGTRPLEVTETTRLTGKHRYGELRELDATFVEIPCKDHVDEFATVEGDEDSEVLESNVRSTSMFIVLPNQVNGLEKLEKNIEKMSVNKLFSADVHEVNVVFPTMTFSNSDYINEDLSRMGLSEIFSETADFSNIGDAPGIKVDKVFNHASLSVHEIPCRASTFVDNSEKSIEFTVNRPFVSVVATNDEDPLILMIARYITVFNERDSL